MRRTAAKGRRRSVREILDDRALMAGFLFSVIVHGAVILWVPFSFDAPAPKRQRLMMARLIRLPAAPVQPAEAGAEEEALREPFSGEDTSAAAAAGPGGDEVPPSGAGPAVSARGTAAMRGARALARFVLSAADGGGSALAWAAAPPRPAAAGGRAGLIIARGGTSPAGAADVLDRIRRLIDSEKSYPRIARKNGWEGRVLVEISLAAGGALEDVQIVDPSGYGVLDAATLKAVRRAGPFPPHEGKVRVPVTYRIDP
jgi:TonB family protein